MQLEPIALCLMLLVVANGAPVLAAKIFKRQWASPIDGGHHFIDQRPLLGKAKTWRGVVAAILATGIVAIIFGYPWLVGILVAVLAIIGDLLASFIKRRLGIIASGRAWMLDQVPESLIPALVLREPLGLSPVDIFMVVVSFSLLDIFLSPLLYRLHIRKQPH
jgi:CDP-2,3-bis-(O-geranylgeranyl)-sn-glycerol synthase